TRHGDRRPRAGRPRPAPVGADMAGSPSIAGSTALSIAVPPGTARQAAPPVAAAPDRARLPAARTAAAAHIAAAGPNIAGAARLPPAPGRRAALAGPGAAG